MSTFFTAVASSLWKALAPLALALESPAHLRRLIRRHGWDVDLLTDAAMAPIRAAFGLDALIDTARTLADQLDGGAGDLVAAAGDLIDTANAFITAVRALESASPSGLAFPLDQAAFWDAVPIEIVDELVVTFVEDELPVAAGLMMLFGVLEEEQVTPTGLGRVPYTRRTLRWDRAARVVGDPRALMREVYHFDDAPAPFDHAHFIAALVRLARQVELAPRTEPPTAGRVAAYYGGQDPAGVLELRVPLVTTDAADAELAIAIAPIPAVPGVGAVPTGWLLTPAVAGAVPAPAIPPDEPVVLTTEGGFDVDGLAGIAVQPGGVAVVAGTSLAASASVRAIALDAPWVILGTAGGVRVELDGVDIGVALAGTLADPEVTFHVDTCNLDGGPGARLVIEAGEGDGLLRRVLGDRRLVVGLPGGVAWSSQHGLVLRGSASLAAHYPVSLTLPGVRVTDLGVEVGGDGDGASVAATASLAIGLGPVTLTLGDVGLRASIAAASAPGGGTFGDVDLDVGLQPPSAVGVAVDAAVVRGGGSLAVSAHGYRGALALDVLGVQVSAHGILDNDVPGVGYSLAAVVSTQFTPIPLGLGFTLEGVGGLIGVNRRVDVDALRAALRGPGIGDIFFADDPVAHAARLTGDLATYFPAAPGRHVFGPAVKIGWGTPTLIEGTVALLLEVPSPVRLVLLGSVSASLPTKDAPIIALNVDVVGELDFGRKTLAIDATLRESKVAGFPITGDLALRMGWGDPPSFVLSVGGFHSQFRAPPGFPALRRVQIPIGAGDNPRLDIQGFLALTSNTAQVGASVDLYAAAGPLNVVGNLGFEALIQFVPFAFQVDLWAGVALRRGTHVLAGVHLDGTLRGPTPWHFQGEACLSLWFIDLCVGFDATFGAAQDVALPAREIWPQLEAALEDVRSWSAAIPAAAARAVTTAKSAGTVTRIDPVAALSVRQKVAPLNRTIERFAQVAPTGLARFAVTSATLGGATIATPPVVEDWFAPAQFEVLTDDERLARPGYETMVAGVTLVSDEVTTGAALIKPLAYETIVYPDPAPLPTAYEPTLRMQLDGIATGANASAPLRVGPRGPFAPPRGTPPLVTLEEESFVIASTFDLAPRLDIHAAAGRGAAELALEAYLADNPSARGALQIVPTFEIAS